MKKMSEVGKVLLDTKDFNLENVTPSRILLMLALGGVTMAAAKTWDDFFTALFKKFVSYMGLSPLWGGFAVAMLGTAVVAFSLEVNQGLLVQKDDNSS